MSKLRGKKPEDRQRRLKMLLSGPAGVGKTTAAIQMTRPYIIDTEKGSIHYGDIIDKSGGSVAELNEVSEVIKELRTLIMTDHPYQTVVIDSATKLYERALEEGEVKFGTEWGAHYRHADGLFKRMTDLLLEIDMNVVVTSHEKDVYGEVKNEKGKTEKVKIDVGYEGYKKLQYEFDLWLALSRKDRTRPDSPRLATVMKTRLSNEFPDRQVFEFTYAEIANRYGRDGIESKAEKKDLPSEEQVNRIQELLGRLKEHEIQALKLVTVAGYSREKLLDMEADRIQKGIAMIENHFKNTTP
jgi:hypothetical protein